MKSHITLIAATLLAASSMSVFAADAAKSTATAAPVAAATTEVKAADAGKMKHTGKHHYHAKKDAAAPAATPAK
jgi:hypothetical protein